MYLSPHGERLNMVPISENSPSRDCLESPTHGPTASPSAVSSPRRQRPPPWHTTSLVVFGHPLRLWQIHAKVPSTTHLCGKTRKPLGCMNLCQSTSSPPLWPTPP